jgi:hypothetical protein
MISEERARRGVHDVHVPLELAIDVYRRRANRTHHGWTSAIEDHANPLGAAWEQLYSADCSSVKDNVVVVSWSCQV